MPWPAKEQRKDKGNGAMIGGIEHHAARNDLRLVLGTRLGVVEDGDDGSFDPDDPDAAAKVVYAYTGFLEAQFIDVLAEALPDVPDEDAPAADPDEGLDAGDS